MRWARRGGAKAVRVLAGLALGGSAAQGVTASWSGGGSDNKWTSTSNWSNLQSGDAYPGDPEASNSYDVEITDDTPRPTVELDVSVSVLTVHVGSALTVQVLNGGTLDIGSSEILDVDSGGLLEIYKGGQVKVRSGTTHTVDGVVEFEAGGGSSSGLLSTFGSVTLGGDGVVQGVNAKGVLNSADLSAHLTIGSSLSVRGELDVSVRLTNDGIIDASEAGKTLRLLTATKDGSGAWGATGGKLQVDVAVSGDGEWGLGDGEIEINTGCTGLGGDLIISDGLLDINADFKGNSSSVFTITGGQIDNDAGFEWGDEGGNGRGSGAHQQRHR